MEEHHHRQLLLPPLFSPDQHGQLMIGPGFFDAVDPRLHFGGGGVGVEVEVAVEEGVDDTAWMDDLMRLGDELFGDGGAVVVGGGVGDGDMVGDYEQQGWQKVECDGASPDNPCSYEDEDEVSLPSAEHGAACEPGRDDGDLSATRKRRDRSKTIVSERKRRFRMKEKLYELRSLVPNITKMDKASIIADAVEYVKNLQSHARKLKADVAALESRPGSQQDHRRAAGRRQGQQHGRRSAPYQKEGSGGGARVTHVAAAQVGEGRFFVTVECERRDGVAAPLCAAVEAIDCFRVESSNLGCSSDRVVSTLTLKACEVGEEVMMSESTVKVWVMAALLKEGFRPELTVQIG